MALLQLMESSTEANARVPLGKVAEQLLLTAVADSWAQALMAVAHSNHCLLDFVLVMLKAEVKVRYPGLPL